MKPPRSGIADTGEPLHAAILIERILDQFEAANVEVDDALVERITAIVRRALAWPASIRLN